MKIYTLIRPHKLSNHPNQPIPTFVPVVCKLMLANAVSLSVTDKDIAHWRANPGELVGKCFTTTEGIMRRTTTSSILNGLSMRLFLKIPV